MNTTCPTCTRPLPDAPMPSIGAVRFCCVECVKEWRVTHNRRARSLFVQFDRRTDD